jgi:hypothetical protein
MRSGEIDGAIIYRVIIGLICAILVGAALFEQVVIAVAGLGALAIALRRERQYRAKRLHGYRRKRRRQRRADGQLNEAVD